MRGTQSRQRTFRVPHTQRYAALLVYVKVAVLKSIYRMPLLGYLIYSIDYCGVYYVFIVFEEAFVHLIFLVTPIPIISIRVNFSENPMTDT